MRSDCRFIMHPEDEAEFVKFVTSENGTVLVDGPDWPTKKPPIVDIENAGTYLMIWNPAETRPLTGRRLTQDGQKWWSCENQFLTIQFLRSGFHFDEPYLFEGRIAVATTDKGKSHFDEVSAPAIERRYARLRKALKKSYTNKVLLWQNRKSPRSKHNPSKPDPALWVGPKAMQWLREARRDHCVKQSRGARASAYVVDLVAK